MLLRHPRSGVFLVQTIFIYAFLISQATAQIDESISEHESKTVILPCPIDKKCGALHSINWFKGDDRIAAMLLDDSNVTSVTAEFQDRVSVEQNPYRLIIKDLQISDEDIYLCDTTFFIPAEACDNFNGYRIELNVLVPPTEIVILDEKGDRIENGTVVGPMQERQMMKATCVVRNTRPQPQVGWWRGSNRLTTHSPSFDEKDGLFTATLELSLQLSRDDLSNDIECRVESVAIPNTVTNSFEVDLQVRPTSITINGVEHHTVQGSKVVLTCDIHGARPPVNVTWYNSTAVISPQENDLTEIRTKAFEKPDGTYHTQSEIIFNATRFENDMVFRCEAENIVVQINREKPFTSSLTLEVLYPPVVKVSPPEITVNTSDTVLLNCEYVANPASLTHVVWYRNGELVNVNNTERYEGGNSENVALVIRSTEKDDIGNYTCQLSNAIGKAVSEHQIDLDVQYVPIVEVLMIPDGPVKESDESNVTLFCNILDANPAVLTKVRWYANSTLLKELPDCEETREDLCHIDPSKLLLESIGRGFFFNYSCEGYNAAGWGPRSEDKELMVHYEPGPATLTHFPLVAIKKKSVTFSCSIEDPGYPESNRFRWLRGGRGPLQDIVTKDWTVEPVGLDSRTNYSCYAFNDGGKGAMATINLEVHASPFFIKNLPPYTGILHTSRNANLTCRIECVPRCEISWLKDGMPILQNDTRYFVKEKYMDASPATGDFESMLSVLHFNMSNWPNNKFDIESDNANYTCMSTANTVGPGIKSSTYFSIEYAPDNTTVSEELVYVQEDTVPGRVICKSNANPEPKYEWRYNNKTIIRGNALIINTPMTRNDTGRYTCVAYNKHGRNSVETFVQVQFKPRCEIERQEIDDQDTLICSAFGNPLEADFTWSIKAENETVEWLGTGDSKEYKDKSFYVLDEDYAIARTYRCVANNTAGAGSFCEIEVAVRPKKQLAWWQRWDKTTLIILVAAILALLLAVIIICCIIICICRRRRRQDKYRTDVSLSATQSVLSYQPTMPQAGVAFPMKDTSSQLAATTTLLPPTIVAEGQVTNKHPNSSTQVISQTQPRTPETKTLSLEQTTHISSTECISGAATASLPNATATTTPTLTVKQTQVPKSPPRWPLRPGVMVHVSNDTKENLAVNRMTLKPNMEFAMHQQQQKHKPHHSQQQQLGDLSTANDSVLSKTSDFNLSCSTAQTTLLNDSLQLATLPQVTDSGAISNDKTNFRKCQYITNTLCTTQTQHYCNNDTANETQPTDELTDCIANAIEENTSFIITSRRTTASALQHQCSPKDNVCEVNESDVGIQQRDLNDNAHEAEIDQRIKSKNLARVEKILSSIFQRGKQRKNTTRDSQRSHVSLLGGVLNGAKAVFWKRKDVKSQFLKEHRLKGIRCSGSVTYKKSSVLASRQLDNNSLTKTSNTNTTKISTQTNALIAGSTANLTASTMTCVSPQLTNISSHTYMISQTSSCEDTQIATTTTVTAAATATLPLPTCMRTTSTIFSSPDQLYQHQQLDQLRGQPPENLQLLRNTDSILMKNPPPPRPPPLFPSVPPPLRKKQLIVSPTKNVSLQIHDKSSSLGDPLTEPGEYENLPFHGLQTAPNKFGTASNSNNPNSNVVRVAPRPKRVNTNIHTQQQTQQQIQYHENQQQSLEQIQYHSNSLTTNASAYLSHKKKQQLQAKDSIALPIKIAHGATNNTQTNHNGNNANQITHNLNNCFPKSYNEFYHQQVHHQQHQKQRNENATAAELNPQQLNAIECDYSAYTSDEHQATKPMPTNPFLATSTFKKLNTEPLAANNNSNILSTANKVSPNTTGAPTTATISSMYRNIAKDSLNKSEDKKFYSLKFTGNKNKINKKNLLGLNDLADISSETATNSKSSSPHINKCKRHKSFAGATIDSTVNDTAPQPGHTMGGVRFYDPPVYENLTDSVQIQECEFEGYPQPCSNISGSTIATATVILHSHPSSSILDTSMSHKKKKHFNCQHHHKDDFNLMEPERLSIYRSDSGISNSSYECATPVPTVNTEHVGSRSTSKKLATPPPKTAKSTKHGKTVLSANMQYKLGGRFASPATNTHMVMNLEKNQTQQNLPAEQFERTNSPVPLSAMINSSYDSATNSQIETLNACPTDPPSLSSSNSLYSSGTGTLIGSISSASGKDRCIRQQKPMETTTPEEFEQYQLGHQQREHSASTLSITSRNVSIPSTRKCKKRSTNEPAKLATNPFLAIGSNAEATARISDHNKKFRRQTISDPYTHIRYINRDIIQVVNKTDINAAHNPNKSNCNATKATGTFKTTGALAIKSHPRQQQTNLQQREVQFIDKQQLCNYQQRMRMPNETVKPPQYNLEHHVPYQHHKQSQLQNDTLRFQEFTDTNHQHTKSQPITATTFQTINTDNISSLVRPVKLPLRKHHSFHFQTSQTVAGIQNDKLQQLRIQMQEYSSKRKNENIEAKCSYPANALSVQQEQQQTTASIPTSTTGNVTGLSAMNNINSYLNVGPFVFYPLTLNENRRFKPISPPMYKSTLTKLAPGKNISESYCDHNNSFRPEESDNTSKSAAEVDETNESLSDDLHELSTLTQTICLSPSTSLEALEHLTQTNSDFSFITKRTGSRQNLHTQLAEGRQIQKASTPQEIKRVQLVPNSDDAIQINTTVEVDDDNGENVNKDYNMENVGNGYVGNLNAIAVANENSNATSTMTTAASHPSHVKYIISQNFREVQI